VLLTLLSRTYSLGIQCVPASLVITVIVCMGVSGSVVQGRQGLAAANGSVPVSHDRTCASQTSCTVCPTALC
jgi:hypothetical protein